MVQGLNKPYFDLSRGASVDDIVNTSAIAALMSWLKEREWEKKLIG